MRVHRSRILEANDVRIRHGLPVTSPARTLLDIAPTATYRQLELAFDLDGCPPDAAEAPARTRARPDDATRRVRVGCSTGSVSRERSYCGALGAK